MNWSVGAQEAGRWMQDPVALAIPAFFLLIAVEWIVARRRGRPTLRFADATTNISCGVANQLCELFIKIAFLAVYGRCYQHRWIDLEAQPLLAMVVALLGVDFCYYLWHRASHENNLMWAAHAVHHQSEDYNLSVALRQAWFTGLTSIPFYLPLAFLGVSPAAYALAMGINLLYQFWIHTELIRDLGPFERWFNTPSHHRVHHGVNPQYLDRNHGGILIVWDRLFGTFEPEVEAPVYGTTEALACNCPVWANLEHLVHTWRLRAGTSSGFERVYRWIAHPAWRPSGWRQPALSANLRRVPYDPKIVPAARRLVLVSQLVVLPAALGVIARGPANAPLWTAFAAATVIAATACWGALLDRRPGAIAGMRLWSVSWALLVGTGAPEVLAWLLACGPGLAVTLAWGLGVSSGWAFARAAGELGRDAVWRLSPA